MMLVGMSLWGWFDVRQRGYLDLDNPLKTQDRPDLLYRRRPHFFCRGQCLRICECTQLGLHLSSPFRPPPQPVVSPPSRKSGHRLVFYFALF